MNINTALYLADVFDDINGLCVIFLVIGCVALFFLSAIKLVTHESEDVQEALKPFISKWPILVVLAVVGCLTPSKNTMYMMMASSYLESTNLPPKVVEALNLKLDKYIGELKANKND